MSSSWLEELEARLEEQLDAFLQGNPQQEALLGEQEGRDRQQRLRRERLRLRQEAEAQRQALLRLAGEIRQWQERVQRARAAGVEDLAARAEAHGQGLMEQGRQRWQVLSELGKQFGTVERELEELAGSAAARKPPVTPEAAGGPRASAAARGAPTGSAPAGSGPTGGGGGSLDEDWAAFEAQQELQELRRRMRP
jgi:hercynine metabolism protein